KIGKNPGDEIVLIFDDNKKEFTISGVYQDVTSGGFTAKSIYDFHSLDSEKYSFSVNLKDEVKIEEKAKEWSEIIGAGINVDPMEDFINQTLGGVSRQLRIIVISTAIVAVSIAVIITVMFLKLRLAKDLSEIAILKAIGFSERDIKQQYMIKIGIVSIMGILSGIILNNLIGEKIVNATLSIAGIGIREVQLISNSFIEFILCPVVLIGLILIATAILMKTIKKYNIVSIINE
ncbi:MAG: FtsX-like permease family protein, partial [Clostridium sp.]|nr:FtsX-like permease family protein [Clostridium sp.]